MAGAPLAGWISDKSGSRKIPAIVLICCSIAAWSLLITWPGGLLPVTALYMASALLVLGAASTVLSFPMAREVSPAGHTGLVTSAVNLGVFLGLAILQPLFGYVLDLGWSGTPVNGARFYPLDAYQAGFVVCLVFACISLTGSLLYRQNKRV